MKAASFLFSALCAASLAVATWFATQVQAADPVTGKPCYECHTGIMNGSVIHGPVKNKECESCHNSGGGDHRRQKGLFGPNAPGAKLCYECHENLGKEKSVHGPIKEGKCTGCHAPHSSPYKKLLRGNGNGFCFNCHPGMATSDKLGHAPVKKGRCLDCHLPHQSTEAKLLKPSNDGICLFCHDKSAYAQGRSVHKPVANRHCGGCHVTHGSIPKLLKVAAASPEKSARLCYLCHQNLAVQKSVHAPVRQGDCGSCHFPHSSPYKSLLRGDSRIFCFRCHDRKPFSKPVGHEPVKEGRCLDCHTPHQSNQAKLIKQTGGLICYECHEKSIGTGKSVHRPVATGECGKCHMVHGADSAKLLRPSPVAEGKTLPFCYNCHQNLAVQKDVHLPVKQGKCTSCHLVHSSPASKLLKADGSALCFGCHEKSLFVNKKYPHKPVQEGRCISCHQPHQSETAKLLKSSGGSLVCFDCHDKSLAVGISVHKPVATGKCGSCHAVHGGENRKLLLGNFPAEVQTPYDEDTYSFCFKCHDKNGFSARITSATGFRNGDVNLHFKHVRGHSCRICHDFHSAGQAKLLRTKFQRTDGYEYTMTFKPTATGGSCDTNCHGITKSYSRQ